MAELTWASEWLRGVLELCILRVVSQGETYGYAVIQSLDAAGLGKVKGGTLYPILNRLEEDGHVVSYWGEGESGPGRKFFRITKTGEKHLAESGERWLTFAGLVQDLLTEAKGKK